MAGPGERHEQGRAGFRNDRDKQQAAAADAIDQLRADQDAGQTRAPDQCAEQQSCLIGQRADSARHKGSGDGRKRAGDAVQEEH